MSPAELMTLTGELTRAVSEMSMAMNSAVAELVKDGWTEQQARELVAAMMVSGMRGQPVKEPEETT